MNTKPRPLIKSFLPPFYCHVTSFTRPSAGLTIFKSFPPKQKAWGRGYSIYACMHNYAHACSKKIIAKSATQRQQKIICHGNKLICKVQSALNAAVDLSGEERVDMQIIREAAMEF